MLRKINLFALLLLALQIQLFAFTEDENYQKAEKLATEAQEQYNKGYYANAISIYDSIIGMEFYSKELYYNLANAYFKSGDNPSAILNYERALRIDPNFHDAKFNLKIVQSKLQDEINVIPPFFLKRWWNTFTNLFSSDSWAILAIMIFVLLNLTLGIYFISTRKGVKKLSFYSGLIFIVLFATTMIASVEKQNKENRDDQAILFQPSITVKSSPSFNSVDLFVLHEGTKVTITDQVDNWYEIKIANGSIGWIPDETLKKI